MNKIKLKPVIPKTGMVYSQKNEFQEIMCKPKLIPLKSLNLMKLEEMEKELLNQNVQLNAEIEDKHIT